MNIKKKSQCEPTIIMSNRKECESKHNGGTSIHTLKNTKLKQIADQNRNQKTL